MTKISVIIPVYNVEKYLKECLDSIINQTLDDIEIICVDDGSTDNSPKILEEYAASDNRIKILRHENQGAGAARNKGMEIAKGKYLSFIDSDDFIYAKMYEILYRKAETEQSDITICDFNYVDSCGNVIENNNGIEYSLLEKYGVFNSKTHPYQTVDRFQGAPWNKLFKNEFIKAAGMKFQEQKRANDIFFVRCAMMVAQRICCVSDKLLYYRLSETSLQGTNVKNPYDFIKALIAIKNFMDEKGIYEALKEEFKYFAKGMFEYNLETVKHRYFAYKKLLKNIKCAAKVLDFEIKNINIISDIKIIKKRIFGIRKNRDGSKKILTILGFDFCTKRKKKIKNFVIKQSSPCVSVIICNYNNGEYLEKCLKSLSGQSLQNIEIICVNDGSTDNSLEISEKCAKIDSRIKIINQENQGPSIARNNALKIAKGEYIAFVDSDDWLKFDALEKLYRKARADKLDMLSFGGVNVDKKTMKEEYNAYYAFAYLPKNFNANWFNYKKFRKYLLKMAVSCCLTMYRRKFLEENNVKFPEKILFEDNIFFTKALFLAKRCGILREKLYFRLIHFKQTTSNKSKHFDDFISMVKKMKELMDSIEISNKIKVKYIVNYVKMAYNDYKNLSEEEKAPFKKGINEILKFYEDVLDEKYYDFSDKIFSIRKNPKYKQIRVLGMNFRKAYNRAENK